MSWRRNSGPGRKAQATLLLAALLIVGATAFVLMQAPSQSDSSAASPTGAAVMPVRVVAPIVPSLLRTTAAPSVTSINLTTTDPAKNDTNQNLTLRLTVSGDAGTNVTNITNWYRNGTSFAALNMPFEANVGGNMSTWTKDYARSNHGTVTGPVWSATAGRGGSGAYVFDGTAGDNINIGSDASLNIAGELTIALWMKTTDPTYTFLVGGYNPTVSPYTGYGVVKSQTGNVVSAWMGGPGWITGSTAVTDGIWHHVAVTVSGTSLSIYVDGQYDAGGSITGLGAYTGAKYLGQYTGGGYNYIGTMDDVRIFNKSLSANQIRMLYLNRTDLIHADETSTGDVWKACVTPNDGAQDGATVCSNNVTIVANSPPVVNSVSLTTTNTALNDTNQNLTLSLATSDVNGEPVANITTWQRNGQSVMMVNMPFEGTGNIANNATDYSGYGNNGTVVGATWSASAGRDGKGAYTFDGSGDAILMPYPVAGTTNINRGSVFAWIKTSNAGSSYRGIVTKVYGYGMFLVDNSFALFDWNTLTPSNSGVSLNDNKWHLVGFTFQSGVASGTKMYIDGVNVANTTITVVNNDIALAIGSGNNPTNGQDFTGTIDDVTIWNRTLSDHEVALLYANRTDILANDELAVGDVWKACVTPNDGMQDGAQVCSNNVTVKAVGWDVPVVTSINLTTTNPALNDTNQNLTLALATTAYGGRNATNITTWYRNGTSIMLLNLPFEGGSNTANNATDYSGFGNNGTVFGPAWSQTGRGGSGAYNFSGASQYIGLNNVVTQSLQNFTIVVNFKVPSTGGVANEDQLYSTGNCDGAYSLQAYYTNIPKLAFGKACVARQITGSTTYALGVWHQAVLVVKTGQGRLYLDGAPDSVWTAIAAPQGADAADTIGGIGTSYPFKGLMDDVQVYNRSLSDHEIALLYQNRTDVLANDELAAGEVWKACVTPNDGTQDGAQACSNNVTVRTASTLPVVNSINVTSTNPATNDTTQNLALQLASSSPTGRQVTNFTTWYRNGTTNMLLYMPFENGSTSSYAKDYSGYGRDASGSATWSSTSGYDGRGAYYFDGSSKYLNLGTWFNYQNFSIAMWLKPGASQVQYADIIDNNHDGDSNWVLQQDSTNTNTYGWGVAFTLTANVWQHLVIIADRGTCRTYKNGVLLGSGGCWNPFNYDSNPSRNLNFGRHHTLGRYWNGYMDDIRIYDHPLNASQVMLIYQNRSDVIDNDELRAGDVWRACVTPNDGTQDGAQACSNNVTIMSYPPVVNSINLTTTNPALNNTNQNLTLAFRTSSPIGRSVTNITNWYRNGTSIMTVYLPFAALTSSSTSTADYSGFGNTATVTNAVWNASGGPSDAAYYSFYGNAQISVPVTSPMVGNNARTTAIWVRFRSVPSSMQNLIFAGSTTNYQLWQVTYRTSWDSSRWVFHVYNNGCGYNVDAIANKWYHVAATHATSGFSALYLDGVMVCNFTQALNTVSGATLLGNGAGGYQAYMNGELAEYRVFNRSLSQHEIALLAANITDSIANDELAAGESWRACVTPLDNVEQGAQACSNNISIRAAAVVMSGITAGNVTNGTATIAWSTDLLSNTTVIYGTTTALGSHAGTDNSVLQHSVALSGLANGTLYYYNVSSCGNGVCNTTGPYSFTTLGGYYPNCPNTTGVWTLAGDYTMSANVSCDVITVPSGITLTVNGAYGIVANSMNVIGSVSATARGCGASTSPTLTHSCVNMFNGGFAGNAPGWGEGGDFTYNNNHAGTGAGYGSFGGDEAGYDVGGGMPYGSALRPFMLGSGGGIGRGSTGGTGGGAIKIITSQLAINGSILSNGGDGTYSSSGGGGGSGGSVWIHTDALAGSGYIRANGGNGGGATDGPGGGGGAGGRVAVYYTTSTFTGLAASGVTGGTPGKVTSYAGSAGSMIFIDVDDNLATVVTGMEFNASDIAPEGTFKYGNEFGFVNLTFVKAPLLFMTTNVSANVIDIDSGFGVETRRPFTGVTLLANSSAKPLYNMLNATDLRKNASVTISSLSNVQVQETGVELLGNLATTTMTLNATTPVSLGTLTCSGTCIIESEVGISAASSVTASQLHLIAPNITLTGAALQASVISLNASENLDIDASSSVSASGRGCSVSTSAAPGFTCVNQVDGGFGGNNGPGMGEGADYRYNNAHGGTGAGYGALGGDEANNLGAGKPYGSALRPLMLGSGGGYSYGNGVGGTGGGSVRITASAFTLDGSISADGNNGGSGSCGSGGGSGGSVWVETSSFAGSGIISAQGGDGGVSNSDGICGGGGSGGRVAVYYTSSAFTGMSSSSVVGGPGGVHPTYAFRNGYAGGPGTMLFVDTDDNVATIVGGMEFNYTDSYPAGQFKPANGEVVNFRNVSVVGSSQIRFKGGDIRLNASRIDFTASNVTVDNGRRLTLAYDDTASRLGRVYGPSSGSFYLSVDERPTGRVDWLSGIASIANMDSNVNLTNNKVYVNTVASPGLNVSANVSINSPLSSYSIIYDQFDTGVGVDCSFCTNLGAANGQGRFTTTHFSSYWLSSPHPFVAPVNVTVNDTFVFNGTTNATLVNGSLYDADQVIQVVERSTGRPKLELSGAFSTYEVNLSSLIVIVAPTKTVVVASGLTGVGPTHTMFVPITTGQGVYVCPNATTIETITPGCEGYTHWTYAQAVAGTSKQLDDLGYNATVTIVGNDYRIAGLRGTGSGEGGVTSLRIWDETEQDGSPYAGFVRRQGEQIVFFANFTNASGLPANTSNGGCVVDFADMSYNGYEAMRYNPSTLLYEFNRSFALGADRDWKVNCTGVSAGVRDAVEANDTVAVLGEPQAVPEFGTWALLIALGLVAGGIVSMRGGVLSFRQKSSRRKR